MKRPHRSLATGLLIAMCAVVLGGCETPRRLDVYVVNQCGEPILTNFSTLDSVRFYGAESLYPIPPTDPGENGTLIGGEYYYPEPTFLVWIAAADAVSAGPVIEWPFVDPRDGAEGSEDTVFDYQIIVAGNLCPSS